MTLRKVCELVLEENGLDAKIAKKRAEGMRTIGKVFKVVQ